MCAIYSANFRSPATPWYRLPPHPDWVNPDGSLKPVHDLPEVVFEPEPWPIPDAKPVPPEPDTYHDDMRRFFCGLLIALPMAGVVWGVLVVAIILGVAKTTGHN